MSELLPCPFCGGKVTDSMFQFEHSSDCYINKVLFKTGFKTKEEWDEAWNTRTNQTEGEG